MGQPADKEPGHGVPSQVMGRHSPLTPFYPWMAQQFGMGESDRFAMCSGIAHDPLQRDVFTPLFLGATICIPTQETIVTPGQLARWMRENEITQSCCTPAMGQILITVEVWRPTAVHRPCVLVVAVFILPCPCSSPPPVCVCDMLSLRALPTLPPGGGGCLPFSKWWASPSDGTTPPGSGVGWWF